MVSKYERGEINPSVEVARKLSKIFEVTMDYLVDDSDTNAVFKNKKMLDRFSKILQMPEEDRAKITDVIDAYIRDFQARKTYSS